MRLNAVAGSSNQPWAFNPPRSWVSSSFFFFFFFLINFFFCPPTNRNSQARLLLLFLHRLWTPEKARRAGNPNDVVLSPSLNPLICDQTLVFQRERFFSWEPFGTPASKSGSWPRLQILLRRTFASSWTRVRNSRPRWETGQVSVIGGAEASQKDLVACGRIELTQLKLNKFPNLMNHMSWGLWNAGTEFWNISQLVWKERRSVKVRGKLASGVYQRIPFELLLFF